MNEQNHPAETLEDIKQMMERSSRFISLSGLSGIAAGTCALLGAGFAYNQLQQTLIQSGDIAFPGSAARPSEQDGINMSGIIQHPLFIIAVCTFAAAFISAFIFTFLRSKKTNTPLWGVTARRLMINVSIPMAVGGIYMLALLKNGAYAYIAPGCLLFYGLALVNASKYTLGEIRYLGYCQLVLGILNLLFIGGGIYFWAVGFGVLHIIYGTVMWWKYERNEAPLTHRGE